MIGFLGNWFLYQRNTAGHGDIFQLCILLQTHWEFTSHGRYKQIAMYASLTLIPRHIIYLTADVLPMYHTSGMIWIIKLFG